MQYAYVLPNVVFSFTLSTSCPIVFVRHVLTLLIIISTENQNKAFSYVAYLLFSQVCILFYAIYLFVGFANQSMVLLKAIVADFIPSSEQAAVYGKMGAFGALGFIVGPIVGGNLLELPNGFYNISLILVGLVATNFG